uniref:PH01B035L11.20 protein n=1 Tax=Phyllostachys edulis TaxID=38705 RepID=L0P243_PHYED|nr:PH01B035L11.20 [Phyllostachys edulis]
MVLWLTVMNVFHVANGKPKGTLTPEQEQAFEATDNLFKGAVVSVLGEKLVDAYMVIKTGKEKWDALEAKFGVSDGGSELYLMEQYHDYRMVDSRSVVEQVHEIQSMATELEYFKCVLPDKFIAGGIIAKLPPSWRNFSTSLKHKRQEFSVENLIGSLDVEEKKRAKDTYTRGNEEHSSANVVQKKNGQTQKFKGKNKSAQTTSFKKKKKNTKDGLCFATRDPAVLMGNGSHATVHGVGTVDLKFTSGKIVQLKNPIISLQWLSATGESGWPQPHKLLNVGPWRRWSIHWWLSCCGCLEILGVVDGLSQQVNQMSLIYHHLIPIWRFSWRRWWLRKRSLWITSNCSALTASAAATTGCHHLPDLWRLGKSKRKGAKGRGETTKPERTTNSKAQTRSTHGSLPSGLRVERSWPQEVVFARDSEGGLRKKTITLDHELGGPCATTCQDNSKTGGLEHHI